MKNWNKIEQLTKIPRAKFLHILRFCLNDNNYFKYGNIFYKQIFGMPMGNPLSPTIADILLDSLLDDALAKLNEININIKYITKYVDDFLAIISSQDKDIILKTLNDYHSKIKFTMEMENEGRIAFLDTKLHRAEDTIIFDWFTKETSSGRIMNYYTTQPMNQIINTAKSFIKRVLNISDEVFHDKNIEIIRKILKNNCFPNNLIKFLIKSTITQLKQNNGTNLTTEEPPKVFYSVPYVPHLIDNANIRNTIKTKNTCFAFKPNRTINTIFTRTKTPIDKQLISNVVYEIQCKGNNDEPCDLIYIGTTKRSLQTRMGEHKADITKNKETTALAQHILHHGHTADFENVKILDRENVEKKRYTIESLRIQQKINKTMNLKEDTDNININYRVVLN